MTLVNCGRRLTTTYCSIAPTAGIRVHRASAGSAEMNGWTKAVSEPCMT